MRNTASLDVTNSSFEILIFNPKEMLGILDLRSLGYYKITHGVLHQKTWANVSDLNQPTYFMSNLIT